MAGLRALHRQTRFNQMLNVAAELFASQGYEATRIEEIAESAQVAPGTVYNYFTSKPNILMALAVRHVRAAYPERRDLVRDPPDDLIEAVYAFEKLLTAQALRTPQPRMLAGHLLRALSRARRPAASSVAPLPEHHQAPLHPAARPFPETRQHQEGCRYPFARRSHHRDRHLSIRPPRLLRHDDPG
jgi:AcrR family transcriptional regulator